VLFRSLRSSSISSAEAGAKERAAHLLGDDINRASDFLTDQVRAFAVTQDRSSMDAYWVEVESAQGREKALAGAAALRLPNDEVAALRRAKAESDRLILMETRAMRLVSDALGIEADDMPPPVAAAALSAQDRALSAQGKLDLARKLVFGTDYWQRKRAIRMAIDDFRGLSQARTSTAARAAEAAANRGFALVSGLVALGYLGVICVFALYYRFVALPIRHYMRTVGTDEPITGYPELKPEGAYELAALAEALNERRAQRIRTEMALRESELKLRTNLHMMPLAAMETDHEGRILTWNPAAELIFGYSEEEVIGGDVLELIVPERLRGEIGRVMERLNQGEVIERHVNMNVRKDGREIGRASCRERVFGLV
jgi:PAS domain S-box-containing protein